jgi:hypothetical protein
MMDAIVLNSEEIATMEGGSRARIRGFFTRQSDGLIKCQRRLPDLVG